MCSHHCILITHGHSLTLPEYVMGGELLPPLHQAPVHAGGGGDEPQDHDYQVYHVDIITANKTVFTS